MHAVGDVADDVQVVGDEDVGEPELALQVLEQVQDLRLDRDVERRHRLVADDQLRVDRERARDADALALAARELVREAVVVLRVEADDLQQLLDAALDLGAVPILCTSSGSPTMKPTRLRGLSDAYGSWKIIIISRRTGRMSRPRELRDVAGRRRSILPAVGSSSRMMQRRHRRLAAARLADDAERLALPTLKETPSTALTRADLLLEDDPARDREVLLQVLDDEQLVAEPPRCRSAPVRRRSGRRCSRRCTSASRADFFALQTSRLRLLVEVAGGTGGRARATPRARAGPVRHTSITYGQRGWNAAPGRRPQQRRRLAGDLRQALDIDVQRAAASPSRPQVYGCWGSVEQVVDACAARRPGRRT